MRALPTGLSLLRIVAQGLVPATGSPSPVAAVGRMLAIQGQQVSAIPHAILARAPHSSRAEVKEAFDSARLVRSWPMRGTVHITIAEDHHWLRAAFKHRYGASQSAALRGVDDALVTRAGELALSAIARRSPKSRGVMRSGTGRLAFTTWRAGRRCPSGSPCAPSRTPAKPVKTTRGGR